MKILSSLKPTLKLATVASAVIATTSLTNCGGGSATSDTTTTVRPKTLNASIIELEGVTATFEFIKTPASAEATANGDTENGTLLYTVQGTTQFHRNLNNSAAGVDAIWPTALISTSYTYQAINDTSGVLQITSSGANYLNPQTRVGQNINGAVKWTTFNPFGSSTLVLNLTFNTDGTTITSVDPLVITPLSAGAASVFARAAPDDQVDFSTPIPITDLNDVSFITKATMRLSNGAAMPVNYSDSQSSISGLVLQSLGQRVIRFFPNSSSDFSLDFNTDSAISLTVLEETGDVFHRDSAGKPTPGTGSYTYTIQRDTVLTNLVISGGTPSDSTYAMSYVTAESQTQNAAGTYKDLAGNTGRFQISFSDQTYQ